MRNKSSTKKTAAIMAMQSTAYHRRRTSSPFAKLPPEYMQTVKTMPPMRMSAQTAIETIRTRFLVCADAEWVMLSS